MADANSTVPKNKARAQVSSNDVQSTERAAVEAEERAHRAKQALKKAKKEAKKTQKAARRARKAADAASKAFNKAARAKKAKQKKAKQKKAKGKAKAKAKAAPRRGGKKARVAASGTKSAGTKVAPPVRKTAPQTVRRPRQVPSSSAPEPMEEPDTFVLGQSAGPATD